MAIAIVSVLAASFLIGREMAKEAVRVRRHKKFMKDMEDFDKKNKK
jgi:hypothetical protein|tara:strand:+ start:429 stop:566 length:138 start_codon:yes stop_codon:yes gene_type:complete